MKVAGKEYHSTDRAPQAKTFVDVEVHDMDRPLEQLWADALLCPENLAVRRGRMARYRLTVASMKRALDSNRWCADKP